MSMRSRQNFFRLCEKPQAVWNVLIALVFQAALTSELLWPSHLSAIPAFPSVWMPLSPRWRAKTQMVREHSQSITRTRRARPIRSCGEGRGEASQYARCFVVLVRLFSLRLGGPLCEEENIFTHTSLLCPHKEHFLTMLNIIYLMLRIVDACNPIICNA